MELLIPLIMFLISIGIIVAIFQMNGRIDQLLQETRRQNDILASAKLDNSLVELAQWEFVSTLIDGDYVTQNYVTLLVEMGVITQDQARVVEKVRDWDIE